VVEGFDLPLIIQDFAFYGPGMEMDVINRMREKPPTLSGLKIETASAGSKYTNELEALGLGFSIAGGWAVQQFVEALDHGVDAMISESSMIRVYKGVQCLHDRGERAASVAFFRQLLPIIAFACLELENAVLCRPRGLSLLSERFPLNQSNS